MTRELELCPFCKGEALLKNDADLGDIFYKEWVQCNDCGASAPIEAWNTRAVTEKQALLNKIAEAAINESWQPIETAPKDGTFVDLRWRAGRKVNCTYNTKHGVWLDERSDTVNNPTHWKPLEGELDKLVEEYKERFGKEHP